MSANVDAALTWLAPERRGSGQGDRAVLGVCVGVHCEAARQDMAFRVHLTRPLDNFVNFSAK